MKILCIGDVVSRSGRDMLFKYVDDLKYKKGIDLCIANCENASHGNGMSRSAYSEISRAGVDIMTMGNHTWGNKEISDILRKEDNVIRPANYNKACPGKGSLIFTLRSGIRVGVISLIGMVGIDTPGISSPFDKAIEEIDILKDKCRIIIVDFHAEATSEKLAMGYFLDGKVSCVFGTHTHVQTADNMIMENGTGYISDLGMTGPAVSILGRTVNSITERFVTGLPQKFEVAAGEGQFNACIFEVDENSGKCVNTERIFYR